MNQMTCSSSMTSLESSHKLLKTPEGPKKPWHEGRQCNSLNSKKLRRSHENKMWRRSWDSQDDGNKGGMWEDCLQSVQGLVATNAKEQGLKEFLESYSNICDWLNSLQTRRGSFVDSGNLNQLAEELTQKQCRRIDINNRAKELMQSFPNYKEEFHWRIKHLNSQWDALEKIFLCQKTTSNNMNAVPTNSGKEDCDIAWLKEWLRKMENELQPLDFRTKWTTKNLEAEMLRHKALQGEIEEKSAEVHAVLRGQCQSQGRGADVQVKRTARLERRWHQLRLRVLEWVELLSGIQHRARHHRHEKRSEGYSPQWESDEDNNEPVSKHPRLGGSQLELRLPEVSCNLEEVVGGGGGDIVVGSENTEAICREDAFADGAACNNSLADVVDEAGDWDMGQSHETESVFNQSGSPVPNSVVEFTFVDGSQSAGVKRKLSPSPTGQIVMMPQTTEQQQQEQHVVPKNISTYYFKHSDTEPEVNQYQLEQEKEEEDRSSDDVGNGGENVISHENKDLVRNVPSQELKLREAHALLELSQECIPPITSAGTGMTTAASTTTRGAGAPGVETSLEPDVDMEAADEEEVNIKEEDNLENEVDEIDELVQNAEWLVKVEPRRVVVESVSVVDELLLSGDNDDEYDEEEELEQQQHHLLLQTAQLSPYSNNIAPVVVVCAGGAAAATAENKQSGVTSALWGASNVGPGIVASPTSHHQTHHHHHHHHHHQHQLRKSSVGSSSGGKRPKSTKCNTIGSGNSSMEYSGLFISPTSTAVVLDGESGNNGKAEGKKVTPGSFINLSNTKKNARTRRWIRAHSKADIQKNTSSCDASAESASESEAVSSDLELPLSSDDPTTVSGSTFLNHTHALMSSELPQGKSTQSLSHLKGAASSCSSSAFGLGKQRSPPSSMNGGVVWRNKKRNGYAKQRPKSFTEALGNGRGPLVDSTAQSNYCFVSDTALNFLGNQSGGSWSSSAGSASLHGPRTTVEREKKKNKIRRRSSRTNKRKSIEVDENDCGAAGFVRSTSFSEGRLTDRVVPEVVHSLSGSEDQLSRHHREPLNTPGHPKLLRLNSDHGSVNTEDLQVLNDQDWDSYQEKYLSEPYSEEPYDPDGTSKLLAFGEDYSNYLDHADSECSSILSGYEPNPRKRRPLVLLNRGEMPESDSDREELNHFLSQSSKNLRFVDGAFRKQLIVASDVGSNFPAEYAEMQATCEFNISSLQLILSNVEKQDGLPFDVDVKSFQGILERWHILKEKITHAAKLQQIQDEMVVLKKDFDNVQSHLGIVDPFDSNDLTSLEEKIGSIQAMLSSLTDRKHQLQTLNEASIGTQLFLKESTAVSEIKKQIQELYALYEENFQLGSYLLEKMRFLQDAWEKFESEKNEFEKIINMSYCRTKVKKELSSATSSDSGHGTDFSHDSSISDSDMDFQERRQKLVALRKRASDLKAFLPPGSPVMDVIDQKIDEAQKGFEELKRKRNAAPLDLKIIYPKKRSQPLIRKTPRSSRSPTSTSTTGSCGPSLPSKKSSRRWRIIRLTLTFHLALMGLLAAAYFLQPKCCEFSNTFRCSLVPHLTHDSLPTI